MSTNLMDWRGKYQVDLSPEWDPSDGPPPVWRIYCDNGRGAYIYVLRDKLLGVYRSSKQEANKLSSLGCNVTHIANDLGFLVTFRPELMDTVADVMRAKKRIA